MPGNEGITFYEMACLAPLLVHTGTILIDDAKMLQDSRAAASQAARLGEDIGGQEGKFRDPEFYIGYSRPDHNAHVEAGLAFEAPKTNVVAQMAGAVLDLTAEDAVGASLTQIKVKTRTPKSGPAMTPSCWSATTLSRCFHSCLVHAKGVAIKYSQPADIPRPCPGRI